jgi:hypothetical protein
MEPPQGGPLLEALLKKAGSGLFGHGTVGKACGEDFAERLTRLQRDEWLAVHRQDFTVPSGTPRASRSDSRPVSSRPAWRLDVGWAWLKVAVPPSIPATAAVRHIDFIDLVMVISWFSLDWLPGLFSPTSL